MLTNERLKQFGEINKDVDIYVNVFSIPKFTNFEWTRDGHPLTTHNSVKYKTSSSPTIVRDTIHGKEVQLEGYNVTLTIHNLRKEDLVIYTVTITNGFGNIIYPIILESSSRYINQEDDLYNFDIYYANTVVYDVNMLSRLGIYF